MTTETPAEGGQIGDYRIEGLLGRSAIGPVYVARHASRDERVALKVLSRHLVSKPAIAQRFLREGRAAARVRHANVIEIFEVGTADQVPFIAMQLLEGESLAQRFTRGPLAPDELVAIMLPVLAAIATAHEHGVVHRDLKPQDIFLRRTENENGDIHPVVLNFGLSKLIGEASLPPMDTPGGRAAPMEMPFYLAPEQVHGGRNVRGATDQYSLAVMMYEGATGRRPFDGDSLDEIVGKVLAGKCEPPHVANPTVPEALSRVITRAMSMNRTERYTSLWATGLALLPLARTRDRDAWNDIFARNTNQMRAAGDDEPRVAATTAIIMESKTTPRSVDSAAMVEPPRPASASPPAPTSVGPVVTRQPAGRRLAVVIGAAVLFALAIGIIVIMRAR